LASQKWIYSKNSFFIQVGKLEEYLNEILVICSQEFNVQVEDAKSTCRKQELVYCRKAFCIVVKELLDVKLEVIAGKLNRSKAAVSFFISKQPNNKYYDACLSRIKRKVESFK